MDVLSIAAASAGAQAALREPAGPAGNPNLWDITKYYYDALGWSFGTLQPFPSTLYSTNTTEHFFSVAAQESNPTGLYVAPNLQDVFVIGYNSDKIHHYFLQTPFIPIRDVSGALNRVTFVRSSNISVASQESTPRGFTFKPDGTKVYVTGQVSDTIYQYSLSTPWNVSTMSYDNISFSVAAQEANPQGIVFKPDGTKMYIIGVTGDDVNEYSLSTAWDISSASYTRVSVKLTQDTSPQDLWFNDEGTQLWTLGSGNDQAYRYNLSTAWNVSTMSYVGYVRLTGDLTPTGFWMHPKGGLIMYVGESTDSLRLTVIGGTKLSLKVSVPRFVRFSRDGTKVYVVHANSETIYQWNLSTPWNIFEMETATRTADATYVFTGETSVGGFWISTDGTKMYIVGATLDTVTEYSLSTAFNISTASLSGSSFSINSQESTVKGMYFKPDGTRFYIIGGVTPTVRQYTMSTAWNLSTASYTAGYSASSQINSASQTSRDLFFSEDGTKMYLLDGAHNRIYQYSLSTAWDISTASYSSQFLNTIASDLESIFFKPDGEQFFIIDSLQDKLWTYSVETE